MIFKNIFVAIAIIHLKVVRSENTKNDYFDIYDHDENYHGQKFPQKYLSTDGVQPTMADLSHYVKTLTRVVNYFDEQPNYTDPNVGIGSYLMKAVLKRTLIDYSHKIKDDEKSTLKDIIFKAENIVSHFIYDNYRFGPEDMGYRLSRLFAYDDSLVYSIGEFNNNTMTKWINSDIALNEFIEGFDNITLPRETYANIVSSMDEYYLISDSDYCISQMSTQPMPLRYNAARKPCRHDAYCFKRVLKMPSAAYALSHRLLYIVILRHARRCYIISEEADKMHMDIMCANMYRETVYLARKGYFYRDLFLEHITLCGLLGYEEFYRDNWFKKAASWVDEDGCMVENHNFELNRTRIYVSRTNSSKEAKALRRRRKALLSEPCMHHQMILLMNVLAYGIRHAAHFMKTVF